MLQQGDVNIEKISVIPHWENKFAGRWSKERTEMKKRDGDVIREGETTGHAHRIVGTDFQLYELGRRIFARILSGDCRIVHEEHKPIELAPGDYEFFPVFEYDHMTQARHRVRRVID